MKGFFMQKLLLSAIVLCNALTLFAQDKAPVKPQGSDPMTFLIMMAVIFAIIYFLMILPQKKKQKESQNMINNLKKGDRIVTVGGLLGTVGNVKDNTVMVKIADNTVVEFRKTAIGSVLGDDAKAGLDDKANK
jgi:preprotein translocase subunit YajC